MEKNIFVTETSIFFGDNVIEGIQSGLSGFRNIYAFDGKYAVIAKKGMILLDDIGNLLGKTDFEDTLQHALYIKGHILVFFRDHYILYDDSLSEIRRYDMRIERYISGEYALYSIGSELYKISDNEIAFIRTDMTKDIYGDHPFMKIYRYNNISYTIDINGDVKKDGSIFIQNQNIQHIKKENDIIFFGDRVISNDITLREKENVLRGNIFRCFEKNDKLYISTYDNGLIEYFNENIERTGIDLLTGIHHNSFVYKKGVIKGYMEHEFNEYILNSNESYIFTESAVYNWQFQILLSEQDFHFSDIDLKRSLVGSYKRGLFLFDEKVGKRIGGINSVKAFVNIGEKLFIISNDGLYSYSDKKVHKIFDGIINDHKVNNGKIYLGVHDKGIYIFNDNKVQSTRYSIPDLRVFFTEDHFICEIYNHIIVEKYEDID